MWRPDRRGDELGEHDVRELELLDMVLVGAPRAELGCAGERLSRLVAAVRSDHPPLRADFAEELGIRVRGGFARPADSRAAADPHAAADSRAAADSLAAVDSRAAADSRGAVGAGRSGPGGGGARRGLRALRTIRGPGSRLSRAGRSRTIRGAGSRRSRVGRGQWLAGLGAAASLAIGAVVVGGGLVSGSSPGGRVQTGSGAASDSVVGTAGGAPGGAAGSGVPQTPVGSVYRLPSGQLAYAPPGSGSAPAKASGGATAAGGGTAAGGATVAGGATAAGGAAAAGGGTAAGGATAGTTSNKYAINSAVPAPAAPPAGSTAAGATRAVESDASLALVAPRGRVQEVADEAIAATDRLGGIVESSNVTVADQGGSQATLALEVPSGALDRTLAAISALAHVSSRSQDTQDITDPTDAARQRLAESRDERTALLRQLGTARTPNQVASIRGQLGLIDGRIAQDEASLQRLVGHASMASVSVTIAEAGRSVVVGGGGGSGSPWRPARAIHAALGVLEAVFALFVVGLAGLVPVAGLAALAWWAAQAVLRRRRQGALARSG
jgi:hypothetical protein